MSSVVNLGIVCAYAPIASVLHATWSLPTSNGIIPPKKAKLIPGQRTLTGAIASSSSSSSYTQGPTRTSQKRGEVECWRDFAERKWKERFSWLDVRADGIYCIFCREGTARPVSTSGSDVFLTRGYTGTRPDVLSRHEGSTQHSTCAVTYRESLQRRSVKRNIDDIIRSSSCLTVDGEAFCDASTLLVFSYETLDSTHY